MLPWRPESAMNVTQGYPRAARYAIVEGQMSDPSDSLFSSDKDSLGEGWGKRSAEDEPALAPVDWTKLPDAPDPTKKVRARLATPAPGSQKESGLLDIQALAGAMKAEKEAETAATAEKKKAPAPVVGAAPARLATAAKASTGSGLIDVAELVRMTEAPAESSESSGSSPIPSIPSASDSTTGPSAPLGRSTSSSELVRSAPASSDPDPLLDDELTPASGNRTMIYVVLGLLTAAVVGLAVYVLGQ